VIFLSTEKESETPSQSDDATLKEKVTSYLKIDDLSPQKMKFQAKTYSTLGEEKRKSFLLNLAFVSWYFSINK
jgi:hypothetical protein